jgi:hypothetical protein
VTPRHLSLLAVALVQLAVSAAVAQPADPSAAAADPALPANPLPTAPVSASAQAPTPADSAPAPASAAATALDEPAPRPAPETKSKPRLQRNFAGSVQLDYMAVPSESTGRRVALDGATGEVSLKLAMDFDGKISANVKVCVACHGFEIGMAFFDVRVADELNFRVGRFTPAFGEFPLRHDPANHRTSDKPLPYDMGRMLRINEWNEGVIPAPWVDNGIEVNGTHFFGQHLQFDYAAYAIGGPRGTADPVDFDFKLSRSGESYYIDNNSRPVLGGQVVATTITSSATVALGVSAMGGTYDPDHRLPFRMFNAHAVLRIGDVFLRTEYLQRRQKMSLGAEPEMRFRYGPGASGTFDPYFVKDGFSAELELPVGKRLTLVLREDGLRRRGNVLRDSMLSSNSAILRHTAALAVVLRGSFRLKFSYEYFDFSDFEDESVIHMGIAGPF